MWYSTLEVAKAFAYCGDYKNSISIIENYSPVEGDVIKSADTLIELHDIYSQANHQSGMNQVVTKLVDLVCTALIMRKPLEISKAPNIIHLFESAGAKGTQRFKHAFKLGVEMLNIVPDNVMDYKIVLKILFYEGAPGTFKYEMIILLGQRLLDQSNCTHNSSCVQDNNFVAKVRQQYHGQHLR